MTVPTINVEVQLLDWSNSRRGGPKLVIQLPDEDALIPFKALTFAQGKIAGQRLMAVFAIVGDDEQPQPIPGVHEPDKPKGMAIAALAGQWCNDADFQAWLSVKYASSWNAWVHDGDAQMDPDEIAANVVRALCGVDSRAELDHSPLAKAQWEKYIRGPWRAELQRRDAHDPDAQRHNEGREEHGRDVQAARGKTA